MSRRQIIFLGSKPIGYHCLHFLIENQQSLNIEIVGLLSNDNAHFDPSLSISRLAQNHHIPLISQLDELPEVDYLISVQYHQILNERHIQKARILAINLHMAPLPEYRGCNQFSFAILDQYPEFGTTLHVMDERIDHGDILFEKRFSISSDYWVEDLYDLTYHASLELFRENIHRILNGDYIRIPQSDYLEQRPSSLHYRSEVNQIKQIDLNWTIEKISRHIRATYMPGFEPPYALLNGEKIFFCREWKRKE